MSSPTTSPSRCSAAAASGDKRGLEALLAADAVAITDGGGVKRAALRPIRGADRVARLFTGLVAKLAARGQALTFEPATVNGEPALLFYLDGVLDETLSIAVEDGRITAFYVVRNPDKLQGVRAIH